MPILNIQASQAGLQLEHCQRLLISVLLVILKRKYWLLDISNQAVQSGLGIILIAIHVLRKHYKHAWRIA